VGSGGADALVGGWVLPVEAVVMAGGAVSLDALWGVTAGLVSVGSTVALVAVVEAVGLVAVVEAVVPVAVDDATVAVAGGSGCEAGP
jgi:hypothetical protein